MDGELSSIKDALAAITRGEVIIVIDAEDREDEGDFVCAAEKATPENVNFILGGRGDFCMPVLPDICPRLALSPRVTDNTAKLQTAFVPPLDPSRCRPGRTA